MATTADALSTSAELEQPKPGESSPPAEEQQPQEQPKPGEVQPPSEETPVQEVELQSEEQEPDIEEAPKTSGDFSKYKPLFKENPELRNIIGREAAFSELGAFSEVKSIIERVPTLSDAEEMASQAEDNRAMAETFRTDPVGFFETLRENDANAAANLARKLPEILAETDAQLFAEQARYYTNNLLDNLAGYAQQSGDKELLDAINVLASKGFGYRIGASTRPAQTNTEADRLRKELASRDQAQKEQAVGSFWDTANQTYFQNITDEIEADLRKSLPDATDAQIERIGAEAWALMNRRLQDQPQTMARVNQYKSAAMAGRISDSDLRAIVNYSVGRARLVKGSVLKEVLKEWSESILRINKNDIQKKQSIAARGRDVGSGVQATNSTAQTGNGKAEKRSVNSILERLSQGNYQPKR